MLHDKGKERSGPNSQPDRVLGQHKDPKIRTLRDDVQKLIDQAKYGDPFGSRPVRQGQGSRGHDHGRQG